jgi:hypothetical protein
MLLITTYYPHQDKERLKSFLSEVNVPYIVLSVVPLQDINHFIFAPSKFPPPDDSIRAVGAFLEQNYKNDVVDECDVVDWETICINSNYASEIEKLKVTQFNIKVVEENLSVEDFRLLPFMENLIKICNDLKLPGTDRLFKTNPKVLIPKIFRGKKDFLMAAFQAFVLERRKIESTKFTGVIPIFNTQLFTI